MTLQQLHDFVAIVLHGGVRSAARALAVSQAGLTKSVARLEEEYGVRLFDRSTQGVSLTPQGRQFFRQAQAVLMEGERAQRLLQGMRTPDVVAHVDVGMSLDPSLRLAPRVMADFRERHGDVTLRITQGAAWELLAAVRDNRLELAVTRVPADFSAPDLHHEVLYEAEPVLVARSGHPLAGATRALAELTGCDWIIAGDPTQPGTSDSCILDLFDQHGLGRPRIVAVCHSLFDCISIVASSDALARLPRAILDHPLAQRVLVPILIEEGHRPHPISLVYRLNRPMSPQAQALAGMLASYARVRCPRSVRLAA